MHTLGENRSGGQLDAGADICVFWVSAMDGFLIRGHDAVEIVALTRARVLYSNVALPGCSNGRIGGSSLYVASIACL